MNPESSKNISAQKLLKLVITYNGSNNDYYTMAFCSSNLYLYYLDKYNFIFNIEGPIEFKIPFTKMSDVSDKMNFQTFSLTHRLDK